MTRDRPISGNGFTLLELLVVVVIITLMSVLVAPRMIGAGVRDLYVAGRGFPSFIGVAQDYSGQAKEIALAIMGQIIEVKNARLER